MSKNNSSSKKNKKKRKRIITDVLMVLFLMIFAFCGGYLGYYYFTSNKAESEFAELRVMIPEIDTTIPCKDEDLELVNVGGKMIQKKFIEIYSDNNEFVGWIRVKDTRIDYPVMHTPGDAEGGEYYIHRDFNEDYSASGLPFVDKNCMFNPSTDNTIIYGHNMKAGTMFHDLLKFEDKDFYETHKTFRFDTIYGDGEYEIVAVIRGQILADDSDEFKYYEFVNAADKDEFDDYIKNIKVMSLYDTGVTPKYGDKLVTLSTCAYHVKDGRFAIIGVKRENK